MQGALELVLGDPDATRALGRALARAYGRPGCVLALEGPLGAGKTSLAKAYVAAATDLGEDDVTSPTFVIANEYPGHPGVLHLDAYRLSAPEDLVSLGMGPLEGSGKAVLVEWSSRVEGALPRDRLEVELAHAGNGRTARLRALGPEAALALETLRKEIATWPR